MPRNLQIISLDSETSGLSIAKHGILSLGLQDYETGESIYKELQWSFIHEPSSNQIFMESSYLPNNIFEWDSEAADFHKFTTEYLEQNGTPIEEVDRELAGWAISRGGSYPVTRKPMGLNVATFDLPFIRKCLPLLSEEISYQCLDLNSLFIAAAYTNNTTLTDIKRNVMEMAKRAVVKRLPDLFEHHALFDVNLNSFALAETLGKAPEWMKE